MKEYKNASEYEAHLRNDGEMHEDCIVEGIKYVMNFYDGKGKLIEYEGSNGGQMTIRTSDRYGKTKISDAIVETIAF